jgi:hypothetical protein
MEVERIIRLNISEGEAIKLISEIDQLEVKFDKEYLGSPYNELDTLKKLKGCILK